MTFALMDFINDVSTVTINRIFRKNYITDFEVSTKSLIFSAITATAQKPGAFVVFDVVIGMIIFKVLKTKKFFVINYY